MVRALSPLQASKSSLSNMKPLDLSDGPTVLSTASSACRGNCGANCDGYSGNDTIYGMDYIAESYYSHGTHRSVAQECEYSRLYSND